MMTLRTILVWCLLIHPHPRILNNKCDPKDFPCEWTSSYTNIELVVADGWKDGLHCYGGLESSDGIGRVYCRPFKSLWINEN